MKLQFLASCKKVWRNGKVRRGVHPGPGRRRLLLISWESLIHPFDPRPPGGKARFVRMLFLKQLFSPENMKLFHQFTDIWGEEGFFFFFGLF